MRSTSPSCRRAWHGLAVHEGAVATLEIGDRVRVAVEADLGVLARNTGIGQRQIVRLDAPDDERSGRQLIHASLDRSLKAEQAALRDRRHLEHDGTFRLHVRGL
jgi:hypothetical protein